MTAKQDDRDRDPDIGSDLGDLARDRGGLGLGQLDVGQGQAERGIAGRAD